MYRFVTCFDFCLQNQSLKALIAFVKCLGSYLYVEKSTLAVYVGNGGDSGQNNHVFQVCQTTFMVPFFFFFIQRVYIAQQSRANRV